MSESPQGARVPAKPGSGWAVMGQQHKPPYGKGVKSVPKVVGRRVSSGSLRTWSKWETQLLHKPLGNVEAQVAGGSHRVPGGVTATSSERFFFFSFFF